MAQPDYVLVKQLQGLDLATLEERRRELLAAVGSGGALVSAASLRYQKVCEQLLTLTTMNADGESVSALTRVRGHAYNDMMGAASQSDWLGKQLDAVNWAIYEQTLHTTRNPK